VQNVSGVTRNFRAYAICSAGSDATVKQTTLTAATGSTAFASVACGGGRRAVGGGVGTLGPTPVNVWSYTTQLFGPLDESASVLDTVDDDVARSFSGRVYNQTGAPQDFKVFALCATDEGDGGPGGGGPGGGGGGGQGGAPLCGGKPATIVGTDRSETIKGTRRADVIVARGGNDKVSGGRGNDVICAGNGADRVSGGAGADRLAGGNGNDRLDGGSGNDRLSGQSGKDTLLGRGGRDRLSGGPARDRVVQ
jgi:Ca2+-binding RTX toxin-like protein